VKLVLRSVRAGRTPWADEACGAYVTRTRRYFPCEEVLDPAGTSEDEGARLLAALPPRGRLVVLDERGTDLSSEAFAALFESAAREGATHLVYAIGGAYGHPQAVRDRAWRVVRLSPMVLNHAVARVLLAEQVYRACTIRAGEPYHHGATTGGTA
jgi:23S rRNA (pseudouridine1915-N3)-methyltransferase